MKELNILHISDAHIQKENEKEIKEISKKLISDVQKVQNENNIKIDIVCFTGDLIQRGDKANKDEKQWDLAMNSLVLPLVKSLELSVEDFIFVPGNHEVDNSNILKVMENGLAVKTLEKIKEIFDEFQPCYKERLQYFYDLVGETYSDVKMGTLGYSFVRIINNIKVGIACVDSAWRSSGKGSCEKGNLYIGVHQIQELYNEISEADFKICMMHHPLEWMEDCECIELERIMAGFDIVLRGHVHDEDDKQVVRQKLKTIYSTAGKLYPLDYAEGKSIDGYNGYTVIKVDMESSKCTFYLRTYFGQKRKEFDEATNICEKGINEYFLSVGASDKILEFSLVRGIGKYFYNMSEKYALIKNADNQLPSDIQQVLISPVLADSSEYIKEEEGTTQICLEDIIRADDNILLIGKTESGKTTILQQIALSYIEEYEKREKIPIYIDLQHTLKGNNKLFKASVHFIMENILDDTFINKNEIHEMMLKGKVIFLIDNVKTNNPNHTVWISKFIEMYGENRFILTLEEEFFQSLDVKTLPDYGTDFRKIFIQYMGKSQIREMVTKWVKGNEDTININDVVEKIDTYCNQINFAKTPFNIAVFMILWDSDNNYIPLNEGIVMQNYLQIVLEKLSPKEKLRTTYSFVIKQDFLSYLAHEMFLKQEYYFTYNEFMDKVNKYHQKKGYNLSQSQFDKIFFDKNILSYSGEYIVFSHTSILEYCLAVYAVNDREFLNTIMSKGYRTYFRNEICFYSGLNQNCTELLDSLSDIILNTVIEHLDLVENLNNVEIMTEFMMSKDDFIQSIQNNRLSQNELDRLSDLSNPYNEKNPVEIKKTEIVEEDAEDFFSILQMYGSVIKNAELLDNEYKIQHLENYMYGMNMLYAMLIKLFEIMQKEMKYSDCMRYKIFQQNVSSEEEFEKAKRQMLDVVKLLFPIAIQNLILESVGTPKLEVAINDLMCKKQNKPFEKFMLIFLKCDLKIISLKRDLSNYIKNEKSNGILKIMLVKLTFYYRARFFGISTQIDNALIDLITEIYMKLNPVKNQRVLKSNLAQKVKQELDRHK